MEGRESECEKLSTEESTETSEDSEKTDFFYFNFHTWKCDSSKNKFLWMLRIHLPYAILGISLVEIICYFTVSDSLQKSLRFEPAKIHHPWRLVTYMFLHEDWIHLSLNVFMQVLFAYFLETKHGGLRILVLYLLGGVTGVLGASCFHPNLIIGASAGVYALLISHLADIVMNLENMKHKVYRCVCIVIIVVFDIAYNIIHFHTRKDPVISWETHVIGGAAGFFLGLILFKQNDCLSKTRKTTLFWLGIFLYVVLMISLIIVTIQVRKCTPASLIRRQYVYFC